jgi:Homeodomain-like domain-containing protein
MHRAERVREALDLAADGLNASAIARETGIPRTTVRDWLRNGAPRGRSGQSGPSCAQCGAAAHPFAELSTSYVYLLGLYLGDGCISSHARNVYRLRISLDAKYPRIIAACSSAMRDVVPCNSVSEQLIQDSWVEVHAYSKSWPCLFPQHGPGPKHQRRILLRDWQWAATVRNPRPLLRGLIHSDGCRFTNTGRGGWRHPRYSFSNVSDDIRKIFCDTCDLLGLHWTVAPPKTVYVSRKADVALLDEFVGPKR